MSEHIADKDASVSLRHEIERLADSFERQSYEEWNGEELAALMREALAKTRTAENDATCIYYAGCDEPKNTCGYCDTHCLCGAALANEVDDGRKRSTD